MQMTGGSFSKDVGKHEVMLFGKGEYTGFTVADFVVRHKGTSIQDQDVQESQRYYIQIILVKYQNSKDEVNAD